MVYTIKQKIFITLNINIKHVVQFGIKNFKDKTVCSSKIKTKITLAFI